MPGEKQLPKKGTAAALDQVLKSSRDLPDSELDARLYEVGFDRVTEIGLGRTEQIRYVPIKKGEVTPVSFRRLFPAYQDRLPPEFLIKQEKDEDRFQAPPTTREGTQFVLSNLHYRMLNPPFQGKRINVMEVLQEYPDWEKHLQNLDDGLGEVVELSKTGRGKLKIKEIAERSGAEGIQSLVGSGDTLLQGLREFDLQYLKGGSPRSSDDINLLVRAYKLSMLARKTK
ncbi:hypothetical protein ACFLRC_03340 [Candidatus Altiarchaeota archaeon]